MEFYTPAQLKEGVCIDCSTVDLLLPSSQCLRCGGFLQCIRCGIAYSAKHYTRVRVSQSLTILLQVCHNCLQLEKFVGLPEPN